MITKAEWRKVTKRWALVALSVCCMAMLTGCGDDDNNSSEPSGIELTNLYPSSISVFLDGELLIGALGTGETAFAAVPPGEYLLQYKSFSNILEWLGQVDWTHYDHKQKALVNEDGEFVLL